MPRKILHLDLDAFYCAVEELQDPSLRGKPFAVGGRPDQRGVVSSSSYPARQLGIRSAMPMARALRLCPKLIILPGRHRLYWDMSRRVMDYLHALTPLVEQVSIDEAFVDVSALLEEAEAIARRLQTTINEELNLPCSLGIASNKLVAKIANDFGKKSALIRMNKEGQSGPPNIITVVSPGEEAAFLAPLPAEALWGVGPKTAARLAEVGIHTIGDIATAPEDVLAKRFGKNGVEMRQHALGIDDSPITTSHDARSISQEVTFARDVRDGEALRKTLLELSGGVGKQLRREGLLAKTVKIKLRWPDFTTLTRQVTLPQPTDQDHQIAQSAQELFMKVWTAGRPVRLLGVGVSKLTQPEAEKSASHQLSLWEAGNHRKEALDSILSELEDRFGQGTIQRGKLSQQK